MNHAEYLSRLERIKAGEGQDIRAMSKEEVVRRLQEFRAWNRQKVQEFREKFGKNRVKYNRKGNLK
jgi:hypothetical protein